jgi:pyruvate/2-oxoglutarate/acetoin dehydrogenase E1 component
MSTPEQPGVATALAGARDSRNLTIVEAMREALREELLRDEGVFILGEDIVIGGAFLVTLGMANEFGPERIINTPISEAGFMGLATGAAIAGMRPIVDFQYGDFLFTAADQLIQQAAKLRYMSNGQLVVPLLIQLPTGPSGRGAQHANPIESFFFNVPGIEIVTPATPYDAKGLLKTAIRNNNIVLFCVHKHLYGSKGRPLENYETSTGVVPEDEYLLPFGEADVKRPGDDVTVVANLLMLHRTLEAAVRLAERGVSVEVIDPRTLIPFDVETVVRSVQKTGRLLVVEENHRRGGWGPWLVAEVVERALPYLDAPVRRITLPDAPIPFSPPLEASVVPTSADIEQAAVDLVGA